MTTSRHFGTYITSHVTSHSITMDEDEDEDDVTPKNRSTLVLKLRKPSPPQSMESMLLERLARLESASLDHEERLKFLDPELKATHSRIDIVESVCDANTNDLIRLRDVKSKVFVETNNITYNNSSNNICSNSSTYSSSYNNTTTTRATTPSIPATPPATPTTPMTDSDTPRFCSEMEDLWEHALTVLDEHDISELYKFRDETGILESHRKHFDQYVSSHNKEAKTKDMYFELIKMMLDREMSEKPDSNKRRDIKEVRKIQGYQDLTNKLFRRVTRQIINNYVTLKERMDRIEALLGTGEGFVLTDKLGEIDFKLEELARTSESKIAEVKEENLNHNTRLGGVETEIQELNEKFRGREELDLVEAEQARIQKEVLEVLEKRIDTNENHLEMLMNNDRKQDESIATLESALPNLDEKLRALESADEFLQGVHKEMATKAQGIEDEGKKAAINIKDLTDALENFKEEKEMSDEKIRAKLELLVDEDKDIRKKLEEFIEDQDKIDDKQNKELESLENDLKIIEENLRNLQTDHVDGKEKESSDIDGLRNHINEVGEKVRQLEGISNQNADVINTFTINHITYNEKFDKLEGEAHEFSRKVLDMLEDNRRDLSENAEELKQLQERVKYNYDRLDTLTEVPLRVQNLEHANNENGLNWQNLRDHVHRLESDINNNSEKIAIETDWREKGDNELNNKIDQLRRDGEAVLGRLEDVDEEIKKNLEKIIGLEEVHAITQEKAVYVETLASRVSAMDEHKQMSEAKMKEELEDNVKGNKEAINNLYQHFTERIDEIKGVNASQSGDLNELKNKAHQLEVEIDKVRDESRKLVDEEIDNLSDKLKQKVDEIDAICAKNEKHVDNLRELNTKLLDDMEKSKQDNLNKMDEKLEAIRREIPNIDAEDFESLVDSKFKLEAKLNDLLERANIISNELEETKKDVEGKHEHTHTIIRESSERVESTMKHLQEKMIVIERTQFEKGDELRKEFEDLKEQTKKADNDLEEQIRQVDNQSRSGIEVVGQQVEEKAKVAHTRYQGLRIDLDINRRDLWTIFMEMYGTMRCYTVVMKSEGSAADHQSACLGVYRSVDWANNRPVYKQENGENYLYYNSDHKSWMVASYVGNEYAWMRYQTSDGEDDHHSSSSSSSSSDSEGSGGSDGERRLTKKVKKAGKVSWKDLKTPDLFNPGWEYKLSPFNDEAVDRWMTDDNSLRVEPLGDVEKITGIIQEIRNSKEID